MGLQERFEQHWLGTLLVVAVIVAGATWTVLNEVLVRPRDEELARLERRLEELDGKEHARPAAPAEDQGNPNAAQGSSAPDQKQVQTTRDTITAVEARGSAAAPAATKTDNKQSPYVFSDQEYIRASVVSVQKSGGRVGLTLTYENLSNTDYRVAIYNGGANGNDTMLIDNSGEKWEMLKSWRGGTPGPEGMIFLPHVPGKVVITFEKATGDPNVSSFTLINYAQILATDGPTNAHWTKVVIKDIPAIW